MNRNVLLVALLVVAGMLPFEAQARQKVFRLGMIGLDTSHVIAFTKIINNSQAEHGCKVVVGYSGGSPDVPSSANRVEGYTKQLRDQYGVEIVDTIEELCRKVDGVLLESVDGRPHLKQAIPVIKAGKPLFIDKPMAGNLADVIEIFRLARQNNVPCWSSSSLRYSPAIVELKENNTVGEVLGCDTFGPCSLEEHHPDLYWYGVHATEMLFTVMGTGCKSVRRVQTDDYEHVVGLWEGGRVGTFRGLKAGKKSYGFTVYGT
ncbi:MAG: Gfo/Idh/MocA family protein, partial [Planctomycetota bacterium]